MNSKKTSDAHVHLNAAVGLQTKEDSVFKLVRCERALNQLALLCLAINHVKDHAEPAVGAAKHLARHRGKTVEERRGRREELGIKK